MTAELTTPAGGSFYVLLHLTNRGTDTCVTGGFPGVAVLDDSGAQAYQATRQTVGGNGSTINLAPGQTATALLSGGGHRQPGGTDCPTTNAILVTPPDTTVSVRLAVTISRCGNAAIQPLVPGQDGELSAG